MATMSLSQTSCLASFFVRGEPLVWDGFGRAISGGLVMLVAEAHWPIGQDPKKLTPRTFQHRDPGVVTGRKPPLWSGLKQEE